MIANHAAAEATIAELRRRVRELEVELDAAKGDRARLWGAVYRAHSILSLISVRHGILEAAHAELAAVLSKEGK